MCESNQTLDMLTQMQGHSTEKTVNPEASSPVIDSVIRDGRSNVVAAYDMYDDDPEERTASHPW